MRRSTRTLLIAAAIAAVAARPALAGTATSTFAVSATVISACTVSGSTLSFGTTVNPLSTATPLYASSTLTVTCTNTSPYTVALNAGANAGGASNFSARAMKSGGNSIGYQLYQDTGHSTVWGDGTLP
jgi:spore coat protein U-like protein